MSKAMRADDHQQDQAEDRGHRVDDELGDEQPGRSRRRRREAPQDALLAVRREADRQGLDRQRGRGDDDQRRGEGVDPAQAAEGGIRSVRREHRAEDQQDRRRKGDRREPADRVAEQQLRFGDDEGAHLVHDSFLCWAGRQGEVRIVQVGLLDPEVVGHDLVLRQDRCDGMDEVAGAGDDDDGTGPLDVVDLRQVGQQPILDRRRWAGSGASAPRRRGRRCRPACRAR